MEHFSFSAKMVWNIWCYFTDYSGIAFKMNNSEGCHGILAEPKHIFIKTPMSFFPADNQNAQGRGRGYSRIQSSNQNNDNA